MPEDHLTAITRTIELAVAPVFLLTALGTLLSVLTNRLGRVVDRARALANTRPDAMPRGSLPPQQEIALLAQRRNLVNYAITFATVSALLVCLVVACAFIGFSLRQDFSNVMAWLFISAIGSYIAALLFFLREIIVTVSSIRIIHG